MRARFANRNRLFPWGFMLAVRAILHAQTQNERATVLREVELFGKQTRHLPGFGWVDNGIRVVRVLAVLGEDWGDPRFCKLVQAVDMQHVKRSPLLGGFTMLQNS